ncbi:MAG: hypothetical protein QOH49_2933 [Acidobacteriota bacterium]|nr:hypothetical protein [Acidobacteriota bacterium]
MIAAPTANGQQTKPLPEHLIALPGGRWALWRCVGLRGAGFPASLVLKLSAPACAEAADQLMRAEGEEEQARLNALLTIERALDEIRAGGEWATSETREALFRAMRLLNSRKLPKQLEAETLAAAAVEAYGHARVAAGAAMQNFRRAYEEATVQVSEEVRGLAGRKLLREAIIWQNRHAFRNHVAQANLREPTTDSTRGRKQRRDEELIASYLQRYCVKNDTIGFFGPVGWARLASDGEAMNAAPGPELTESRMVSFEVWGIQALADMFAADKEVLQWVAPRLLPYVRVEGNALHLPASRPTMLTPRQAAVLSACDGERLACEIAEMLRADARLSFKSDADVYKVLAGLHSRGLIIWGFTLPLVIGSEKNLRRMLERIGPARLREPALVALDELERARDAVAAAAGEPEQLDCALGELEETFTRLTGLAPTRAHGQMYASRTLIYEDCRRGIEMRIGPDVLETLGPPLSLMLTSSRWVSHKVVELYKEPLYEIYEELARKGGSPVVDAATLWTYAQPLMIGDEHDIPIKELEPLLQERWARVLSLPEGERRVQYTTEELRPRVEEAFGSPRPGWTMACHHSPDLMIAAESVEAIRRGDYLLVIGELHLATNTLIANCFVSQHPAPEEFARALDLDFPEPRPSPIKAKSWPRANVRTWLAQTSAKDWKIDFAYDSVADATSNVLRIADLVVEEIGSSLVMRTRDGRVSFDALDAIGEGLSALAVNGMKILPPARHTPRITIDRLVVNRESWGFHHAELEFAGVKDEAERFLAARAWGRAHAMPRFVFVKLPTETKPFYLDFESPIYVDVLSKVVRQMEGQPLSERAITVSEMLPGPDQTWLPDAEGNRYTSELRMVAVDLDYSGHAPTSGTNFHPVADEPGRSRGPARL